ncbi:MAG: TetR/AcrR family transcriptional regulator, partial [Proteobacteria bacterium]
PLSASTEVEQSGVGSAGSSVQAGSPSPSKGSASVPLHEKVPLMQPQLATCSKPSAQTIGTLQFRPSVMQAWPFMLAMVLPHCCVATGGVPTPGGSSLQPATTAHAPSTTTPRPASFDIQEFCIADSVSSTRQRTESRAFTRPMPKVQARDARWASPERHVTPGARLDAVLPAWYFYLTMGDDTNNVRDRILDAAVSVLESSGIKKFAQPHIARIAGIPQGHLTYYFPKRKDLLSAAAGRFVGLLLSDLPQTLRKEALGKVQEGRAYAVGMAARVVKNRARMRMLLSLVVASEEDPKLARDMADTVDVVRKLLERVLGKDADPVDVELALA